MTGIGQVSNAVEREIHPEDGIPRVIFPGDNPHKNIGIQIQLVYA